MKCSKCGEECRDNQAFCLRCGTPIQVVPDFNLIEAELANSVGELLDEEKKKVYKSNEVELDFLEDEHYINSRETMTKPYSSIDEAKKNGVNQNSSVLNKAKLGNTANNTDFLVDGTGFTRNSSAKDEKKPDNQDVLKKEKKLFKIKLAIFSFVAIIIVIGAVILLKGVNDKDSKDSFTSRYNLGYDYYTAKDYSDALIEFSAAKKLTQSNEDNIKVNKSLLATYEKIGDNDTNIIEILKELIELDSDESIYYEELAAIYDKNDMIEELDSFVGSITDVSIASKLSNYSVSKPQFSQDEGIFDTYISIKLTLTGKGTIYYTIDGSEPSVSSEKYAEEIKLASPGTFTIKAFAVSEKGVSSKIVTKNYEINPTSIEGPVVTPVSGEYKALTTITVTVPDGMKCYYTYAEKAVVPTTTDQLYTEPVPMLRGKYIFSAILVSGDGKTSEVVQNIYQLSIERTVEYNDALKLLESNLIQKNILSKTEEGALVKANGFKTRFTYNRISNIDNNEYYIINLEELNAENQVTLTEFYGVDTVAGTIVKLITDTENAGSYKITE